MSTYFLQVMILTTGVKAGSDHKRYDINEFQFEEFYQK